MRGAWMFSRNDTYNITPYPLLFIFFRATHPQFITLHFHPAGVDCLPLFFCYGNYGITPEKVRRRNHHHHAPG